MTFDPNASLDPGQITDRRGMGGRGVAIGGGGAIGLVLLLAYTLLGGNPNDLGPLLEPGAVTGPGSSQLATDCKTGADANARDDCRVLGYVNSIQAYWTAEFQASGETYRPVNTILFSGATQSGCGTASASTGPFYCPPDELVYLDADFFKELRDPLRRDRRVARPGLRHRPRIRPSRPGPAGPPAAGRQLQRRRGRLGPDGAPGRLLRGRLGEPCREHQVPRADHAAQIADALDAASAVGDDRIQAATSGQVNPDSWTHGSSAQRQKWFGTGYDKGRPVGLRHVQRRHLIGGRVAGRRVAGT